MELNFKSVLVLAPHTDDGELGAGGTIAKLIEQGACVTYAAFSTAQASVPKHLPRDILSSEVKKATGVLGISEENLYIYDYEVRRFNERRQDILEDLIKLRRQQNYDLVLAPALSDVHQDHRTIAEEATRAFKGTTLLGYELVWNNLSFQSSCCIKLQKRHVEKRIAAIRQYASQEGRPYMQSEFHESLCRMRGVQIGAEYAESFEVIRWVID